MAQLRANKIKCVVQYNTTLRGTNFQPENNITLELLGAISRDDVKQVEEAIKSVELRKCFSMLCIGCKMGSLNVVKSVANKFPDLCLEADDVGRIPLHIAITEGKAEVVRELVQACPESLDHVTQCGETVIHFALKSSDSSCLEILQQEIHRLDKHYLLEDLNPTNATSKASFEIDASRISVQEVRIAVPNQGKEDKDMPNYSQSNEATNTSPTQQSSMLLNGMVFTAAAIYAGLFNFYTLFPRDKNPNHLIRSFHSREVFFSPGSLPEGFWFLTATTFTFVSSMISILVAICSAAGPCSFVVRAVTLLVLSSLFISYMMMVKRLVPHFVVITASGQLLSGFEVLCLYTLIVILLLMAVALMVRILWTFRHRFSFGALRNTDQIELVQSLISSCV